MRVTIDIDSMEKLSDAIDAMYIMRQMKSFHKLGQAKVQAYLDLENELLTAFENGLYREDGD